MQMPGSNIYLVPVNDLDEEDIVKLPREEYLRSIKASAEEEQRLQPAWMNKPDLKNKMFELMDGITADGSTQTHVEITLDWAMQVRLATEMPWAQCLQLAEVW